MHERTGAWDRRWLHSGSLQLSYAQKTLQFRVTPPPLQIHKHFLRAHVWARAGHTKMEYLQQREQCLALEADILGNDRINQTLCTGAVGEQEMENSASVCEGFVPPKELARYWD